LTVTIFNDTVFRFEFNLIQKYRKGRELDWPATPGFPKAIPSSECNSESALELHLFAKLSQPWKLFQRHRSQPVAFLDHGQVVVIMVKEVYLPKLSLASAT
jgi:hypothetical protein